MKDSQTCATMGSERSSRHPRRFRLLTVLSAVALMWFLSVPAEAAPTRLDQDSALNSLLGYLDQAGYDLSNTVVVPRDDQRRPLAWSNHIGPYSAVSLNVGTIQAYIDAINLLLPWLGLTLDSPGVLGFMLFIMAHEFAHINCCQEPTGSVVESICDELLAQINGANAACAMVAALAAAAGYPGQPLSDFMSALLHSLCKSIEEARETFEDPEVKAAAASCAAKEDSGEYSPCRCTASSWDPPIPDPCSGCPGFPDPGDPDNPYPNGVIPACDICDHI